jgi:hypothetical protein
MTLTEIIRSRFARRREAEHLTYWQAIARLAADRTPAAEVDRLTDGLIEQGRTAGDVEAHVALVRQFAAAQIAAQTAETAAERARADLAAAAAAEREAVEMIRRAEQQNRDAAARRHRATAVQAAVSPARARLQQARRELEAAGHPDLPSVVTPAKIAKDRAEEIDRIERTLARLAREIEDAHTQRDLARARGGPIGRDPGASFEEHGRRLVQDRDALAEQLAALRAEDQAQGAAR